MPSRSVRSGLPFTMVALGLALMPFPACGGGGPRDVRSVSYELFETTHELDAASLAALAPVADEQHELRFGPGATQLDGLAVGEVLLAPVSASTPRGLLRRVLSVTRAGDELIVATEPTTVFHAFRRLDVEVAQGMGVEGAALVPPQPPSGPGAAVEALTIARSMGIEDEPIELFDGDGNPSTTEDRVAGTGTLLATVRVHFWLHFDWEDLSPAEALSELDADGSPRFADRGIGQTRV